MADSGFGTTITFSSGFFAEILSVDPPSMERAAIATTHSTTTGGKATFIPSDITDYGEIGVEIAYNPSTDPPIDAAVETCTITFPIPAGGSTAATWAISAFMTNFTPTVPIDDRMTARATLKCTGDITVSAGS